MTHKHGAYMHSIFMRSSYKQSTYEPFTTEFGYSGIAAMTMISTFQAGPARLDSTQARTGGRP